MDSPSEVVAPHLEWSIGGAQERGLRADGFEVVSFSQVRRELIEPARRPGVHPSLTPRGSLVARFGDGARVAVVGIPLRTVGDLRDVYGYVVEPAFRHGWELRLFTADPLETICSKQPVDPDLQYPWTLQRLEWVCERYERRPAIGGLPPLTPIEEALLRAMSDATLTPRVQYGIGPYTADFAFPERMLCVEADGRQWHDAQRDARRDEHLRHIGWTVLRFSGSAIFSDASGCAARVAAELQRRPPTLEYSELPGPAPDDSRSRFQRLLDAVFPGRRGRSRVTRTVDVADPSAMASGHEDLGSDADQQRAVAAHDGVVQVIAPAGSGKTTVIVERAVELVARGIPERRILCTTFNRATRIELEERLKKRGCADVTALNFHALGRRILDREGLLRSDIRTLSHAQLRRLCRDAKESTPDGVWIEAPDAQDYVEDYKLAQMIDPPEAAAQAHSALERTAARIYQLYEQELSAADVNDFSDLILRAVQVLQQDDLTRKRWQDEWWCVLVDEYQDIEPAQEFLIQLVAAPQDSLFVVGDEDQCIYAWRRATVERIVELDRIYPGLDRIVLTRNYRCPTSVVTAARRLIEHNQRRFHKAIEPAANASAGIVAVESYQTVEAGAARVAEVLADLPAQDVVVLARTSKALRDVALACIDHNVPFFAAKRVISPSGAELVVTAYLRALFAPQRATEDDVRRMFAVPNRYLPNENNGQVLAGLRLGEAFETIFRGLGHLESFREKALTKAAPLLESLRTLQATPFIAVLRDEGGLDRHYGDQERLNRHDLVEIDALDDIARLALLHPTPIALLEVLEQRQARLADAQDENGVELTTIHGAKGRQWDTVILFAADQALQPHRRALEDAEDELKRQEVIEDERRLAYVAITRAERSVLAFHQEGAASQYLYEAGLIPGAPPERAEEYVPTSTPRRTPSTARTTVSRSTSPANSRTNRAPSTRARHPGECDRCSKPITPGQQIMLPPGARHWVHERCP